MQRHNTPHPKDLRTWRNKAAKKFHPTDGNLLHHDHQHPFQPNAHGQRDSLTHTVDSPNVIQESIDYIPPEISTDNHQDSEVKFLSFLMKFKNLDLG